jgi:DNA-binding transcriptional ArsR family regulator
MVSDRELERVFKAVANRKRIAILRHLKNGSASVGEMAKAIKLSVKATSRHLQLLSGAGYVVSEQRGLFVFYSLNPQPDAQRVLKNIL